MRVHNIRFSEKQILCGYPVLCGEMFLILTILGGMCIQRNTLEE